MLCPHLVIHFRLFHTALRTLGGETTSSSRTKVWSRLGEVKSRSCESSRLNSRKFSKIRVSCLSHVDSCPNFDPSVQPGSEAGGLAALQRQSRSSPFSKVASRMRGRGKGRSLLRCLHVTSRSKSQSGYQGKVRRVLLMSQPSYIFALKALGNYLRLSSQGKRLANSFASDDGLDRQVAPAESPPTLL